MKILFAVAFLFLKTGERFATQDTAGPTVAAFTAEVAKQLDGAQFDPRVFNRPAAAIEYVTTRKPALGIVTPGFYLAYAKPLGMKPLLEVHRQNVAEERYVVVVRQDAAPDLAGKTLATTLAAEERFVLGVALQDRWREVRLKPVEDVELAALDLADNAKDAAQAVLMEQATWEVLAKDEELGPKLKVAYRTEPLPGALLVSFPNPAEKLDLTKATELLRTLDQTEPGKQLLASIQVQKFSPINEQRLRQAEALFHGQK